MDPALWELLKSSAARDDEEVEAIVRLDDPLVDVAGVRIVSRFGPIATCRLSTNSVLRVRGDSNVLSLKAPRALGPEIDASDGGAASALVDRDVRRPPGLALGGANVCVGVVDWGCDFDHPNFKDANGSTRLLALWDQRGSTTSRSPRPFGYGTVYTSVDIDSALRAGNPYEALGYHPADADRDGSGAHGTCVMDIAAGNGRSGGPVGIAPNAELIFVHLADRGTGGLANLGDSVRILEAVDFVRRTAGNRPWVINLSVGRHGGPHDGTTLAELALDFMLGAGTGRFIVQSAGNYFDKSCHMSGRLEAGDVHPLTVVTDERDVTPNELEVWYSGRDELAVELESPIGVRSPPVGLGEQADVVEGGQVVGRLYHRDRDPNNLDNHVELFLYPWAPAGSWVVNLRALRAVSGVFHAWLERDEYCADCQAHFRVAEADDHSTTGTIANGHATLVVGAYDAGSRTRPLARFSSAGPTRDGRLKPDLVAPGVDVLAARSAPPGSRRSPGSLGRKSGTSFAAPHVAGTVALCLERAPGLASSDIRDLLLNSARAPSSDERYWWRFGHGYLDVANVVAAVSALGSSPGRAEGRRTTRAAHSDPEEESMYPDTEQAIRVSPGPERLYREVVHRRDGPLPAWIDEAFAILARPGEVPSTPPAAGDLVVRVALGEPGLGHVAVLSGPGVRPRRALEQAGVVCERGGRGLYATVVEGGALPHTAADRYARRILDETGRMPIGQLLLRPKTAQWIDADAPELEASLDEGLEAELEEADVEVEEDDEPDEATRFGYEPEELELTATMLEEANGTAKPEIVLVAGVNYPKYKAAGRKWKRIRRLSAGPWRKYCLTVAADCLKKDPNIKVTMFDVLLGTREDIRLVSGNAVSTVEAQFATPADKDYWNLVGIDLTKPSQAQAVTATLEPANTRVLTSNPQVNYYDGVSTASQGKAFKFLSFFLTATRPASPVLSITDVYAYIEGFSAAGKKGLLRELHFFSHAFNIARDGFSGGPILANSLDNPLQTDRHPLDKDGRSRKDFAKPTMDPVVFAEAFGADARSFVWGCNFQRGFIRQFVHQVARNRERLAQGGSMKISHGSDWGDVAEFRTRLALSTTASTKNVDVDLAKVEQVLRDTNSATYMKRLATTSGRPVVGGPPGTYADTDSPSSPLELQHIPMTKDPFRDADVSFERALIFFRDHLNMRFDKSFGDHNGLGRGYMVYDP